MIIDVSSLSHTLNQEHTHLGTRALDYNIQPLTSSAMIFNFRLAYSYYCVITDALPTTSLCYCEYFCIPRNELRFLFPVIIDAP